MISQTQIEQIEAEQDLNRLMLDVLGAVARGWTHDANKHKQMDVELVTAIAKEVQAMILAKL